MKIRFAICCVAVAALAGTVEAGGGGRHHGGHKHHGGSRYHGSVGVWVGAPIVFGAPYYYPYAYPRYYYPPPYYPPAYYPPYYRYGPPAEGEYRYEERGPSAAVEPPTPNWYYCREAESYYPHVQQCPGGWEEVPAKPPAAQR